MAINFPSTAGQATDGSYTYTVAGITYSWDGSSWRAAGAGASATDKTLFSVTQNAAGSAALSYNSNSGVFSYTPPDLSSYLTAEVDTLESVMSRSSSTTSNLNQNAGHHYFNDIANEQHIGWVQREGVIRQYTNRLRIMGGNPYEEMAVFNVDGSVELYYDGSKKLETSNTGITVTGALTAGGLTAGGLTYPTSNGTSGQALISDGAGNVNWGSVATTGLQSRTTAQITNVIGAGASANNTFSTPKAYALMSIQTNVAAWVTLYSDTASRTNDASRSETTDPTPGSGVLAEVITTGSATQLITPGTICFNSSPTNATYAKIVNKSGSTTTVTVTLTFVQIEA